MTSELDSLIQLGHDIVAHKYYALATGTLLFYDYLLTLPDEVKYAWSGKKSWAFWLFLLNRYFPMTWQFWQLGVAYAPRSELSTKICDRTSWYSLFMFLVCTLLAQIVLTLRIYAVSLKHIPVTVGFAIITACQFVVGACLVVSAAMKGTQPQPPVVLDAYHLCVWIQPRGLEVAYTSTSLLYDSLAFLLIVFWAKRSKLPEIKIRTILDTIAEDATCYFLVIFTSHLVLVLTLNLGRTTIKLLPGPGVLVYLPLMISRIMLSLKKAANSSLGSWSLMEPTTNHAVSLSLSFLDPQNDGASGGENGIPLYVYSESSKTSTR